MIKQFYSSSDYRLLKEQSFVMFEEVSDGIYLVIKDRRDEYRTFATSQTVAEALNLSHRVAVSHEGGSSGYANFNF